MGSHEGLNFAIAQRFLFAEDDRSVRQYLVLEWTDEVLRLEDLKDGRRVEVPLRKCGSVSYRLYFRLPRPVRVLLALEGAGSTQSG